MLEELNSLIYTAESINVYTEGKAVNYRQGAEEYRVVMDGWKNLTYSAYEMPAFGVALNNETIEEMKRGRWVEFCFNTTVSHNGMPFEKLLFELHFGYSGFNLVRYSGLQGYSGRCFYISLIDKNMDDFVNLIGNL